MKGLVYLLRSREPSLEDGKFVYKYGRTNDEFSLKNRIYRAAATHERLFDERLKFELIYQHKSKQSYKSETRLKWLIIDEISITVNEFFHWDLDKEDELFSLAKKACLL